MKKDEPNGARLGPLTVANLDFEYEISSDTYEAPAVVKKYCARWSRILRLLPGLNEAVTEEQYEKEPSLEVDGLEVWGVTPRTARVAETLGISLPPVSVVREVNSKLFSHHLEQIWDVGLPHASVVNSLHQLENAVRDCPYDWVLKHPMGVSGRERSVGKRGVLSKAAVRWAQKRWSQGSSLLFEPWVERTRDFSLHFHIEPDGSTRFVGVCQLLVDDGGHFRGNYVRPASTLAPLYRTIGEKVCAEISLKGYRGPVGIDCFEGVLGPDQVRRPLVEINARYTFGRMALALGNRLPEGWCYLWWHPSKATLETLELNAVPLPSEVADPGVYLLPETVDPFGATGTYLLVAPQELSLRSEALRRFDLKL